MNGHPTREQDFDLYALGALEGDEKAAIGNHVATCASCAEKLADARGRLALLALAAPAVAPSPSVRARLMNQVRSEKQGATRAAAVLPVPDTTGGLFGRWWAAVLVPVGFALALASFVLWTQNRRLDQQLAALHSDMQREQQQLQSAREVADLINARDTVIVPLAAQPGMPKGSAHVMYNAKMGMLMYEGQLEPNPANKSYQLWIVPTQGNPISAGVFNAASTETDHFLMKLPPGIAPKAFAVTLEPAGGRPAPTGPMVLVGAAS
jgi:anti-sigma-K factor RskA